jgi:hypothetical protein
LAQTSILGKIRVNDLPAEGVHVVNLVTEKATVTNAKGEFTIEVSEDDLLVFSAVHLNYWRRSISKSDIQKKEIDIVMTPKVVELEGVTVTEYPNINAQNMGIINYKPKVYTPAERKLRPTQMTQRDWIEVLYGKIPIDPFLYWITGRTKKLKKELSVEKKELIFLKTNQWFEEDFYINELKIPADYIQAFNYYILYDSEYVAFLESNSKEQAVFRMAALSVEFLKLLEDEN